MLTFTFPAVKVIDYDTDQLDTSDGPFAPVTRIHLEYLAAGSSGQKRFDARVALTRRLYQHGFSREQVIRLYRFLGYHVGSDAALRKLLRLAVTAKTLDAFIISLARNLQQRRISEFRCFRGGRGAREMGVVASVLHLSGCPASLSAASPCLVFPLLPARDAALPRHASAAIFLSRRRERSPAGALGMSAQ